MHVCNAFVLIKLNLLFSEIKYPRWFGKATGEASNVLSPSSTSAIKDDIATAVETVAAVTFPGAVEAFRPAKALPWTWSRAIQRYTRNAHAHAGRRTENTRVLRAIVRRIVTKERGREREKGEGQRENGNGLRGSQKRAAYPRRCPGTYLVSSRYVMGSRQ